MRHWLYLFLLATSLLIAALFRECVITHLPGEDCRAVEDAGGWRRACRRLAALRAHHDRRRA